MGGKYGQKEDAMKVLVIGAAGRSGEALVNEALAAGHKVTAFVRGAAQYKKANVRVVAGDVLDAAAVDVAVAGQDAVIDALGGKTPWKVTTMETSAAHNIVDAMRPGVRRLLKISVVVRARASRTLAFSTSICCVDVSAGSAGRQGGMAPHRRQQFGLTLVVAAMLTDDRRCEGAGTEGGEKAHKIGEPIWQPRYSNWKVVCMCVSSDGTTT